jgi:Uma2 family endonuclease
MTTILNPPEQRVLLHNVSWNTYERLLMDLNDSCAPRLTYDRGTLEIMSPSSEHERYNRTIAQIVEELAVEMNLDFDALGSTTFWREDLDRGFEPDSCFYIQNVTAIRRKKRIDLAVDPPPDLIIEIDITSTSLDRFSIYAEVGVLEVWHFEGNQLTIHHLRSGIYEQQDSSVAFTGISATEITTLIKESETMTRPDWVRRLRQWIRERKPATD